jgi:hypothetical protein
VCSLSLVFLYFLGALFFFNTYLQARVKETTMFNKKLDRTEADTLLPFISDLNQF